jgi:hypothetical protein
MLALLIEYRFRVHITYPCDFGQLFDQNEINFWKQPEFIYNKQVKILKLISYENVYVIIKSYQFIDSFK